jgi:hypothetical protein
LIEFDDFNPSTQYQTSNQLTPPGPLSRALFFDFLDDQTTAFRQIQHMGLINHDTIPKSPDVLDITFHRPGQLIMARFRRKSSKGFVR